MTDKSNSESDPLSPEELQLAEELQYEIRRKLAILLALPGTPQFFKDEFSEFTLESNVDENESP